jgi:hypothetical protein
MSSAFQNLRQVLYIFLPVSQIISEYVRLFLSCDELLSGAGF